MIAVRSLTRDDYANYALLIIYAWDMCDAQQDPASDDLDPRIAADGWTVKGIITGNDDVMATAPSVARNPGAPQQQGGLRQAVIRPGNDRKRYGYLAVNASGDTYAAVIRGTDGAEEWIDDCVFIADQRAPFPGRVETGFADIYLSMQYRPLAGGPSVKLADGIAAAVGGGDVLVLGHSLGAALAECLAFELADPAALGGSRVGAIMFASPKLGDHDFVTGFAARVSSYTVINYEHDVVPRVPPFDITHLDLYRSLPYIYVITDEAAAAVVDTTNKACCHHLIDYIGMLSPAVFARSRPAWTNDETECAKCIVSWRS